MLIFHQMMNTFLGGQGLQQPIPQPIVQQPSFQATAQPRNVETSQPSGQPNHQVVVQPSNDSLGNVVRTYKKLDSGELVEVVFD